MLGRSEPEPRSGVRENRRRERRAFAPALLAAAAILAVGVATSCGPSVQSIYEGNVRFEHCYRLDLDLDVASSHREACWKRWLSTYTYGQPRDRIEYARRRMRAFAAGDVSRPALNVGAEHRPQDRQFYLVVPAPTSVHAPPPPIATRVRGAETDPPPKESAPLAAPQQGAPGSACVDDCRAAWKSCRTACEAEQASDKSDAAAGSKTQKPEAAPRKPQKVQGNACKSCEPDYNACMKRCFE